MAVLGWLRFVTQIIKLVIGSALFFFIAIIFNYHLPQPVCSVFLFDRGAPNSVLRHVQVGGQHFVFINFFLALFLFFCFSFLIFLWLPPFPLIIRTRDMFIFESRFSASVVICKGGEKKKTEWLWLHAQAQKECNSHRYRVPVCLRLTEAYDFVSFFLSFCLRD